MIHWGRVNMPPEKTSWKIRIKGMIVMAAVVVWQIQEMKRAIISAAYVIRNMEMPMSKIIADVKMPSAGKRTRVMWQTYMVSTVCARQSRAW